MLGWRGKIGVLYPSAGLAEEEFAKLIPKGVSLHFTRMKMRRGEIEMEREMVKSAEETVTLLADAGVDIILFGCTIGSLIGGLGFDKQLSKKLEDLTGIPTTTTTSSVIKAMESLRMRRIILLASYPEDVLKLEIDFLKETGVEVIQHRGLGISDPHQQVNIDPGIWYRLSKELAMNSPDIEGIFISCGGITVVDMIQPIEEDLRLPVVTSNQAAIWNCLGQLNIKISHDRYGKLFNSS
jgi:maleate isomerase